MKSSIPVNLYPFLRSVAGTFKGLSISPCVRGCSRSYVCRYVLAQRPSSPVGDSSSKIPNQEIFSATD